MIISENTLFDNRFRLLELKGRGSFGEVWHARDERLKMEVALKVFVALDSYGIEVFKSEYNSILGLSHPNLLSVYHLGFCDNRPYLVMPYCSNSAGMLIGKVDEVTLWQFIHDVASGLACLHEKGIVHNDMKPDNVLIDQHNHFVVTDYGISPRLYDTLRQNWERENQSVLAGGATVYKAPEWFNSPDSAVYATDIWALGVSLYELASGELPLYGQAGTLLLKGAEISRPQWSYSKDLTDTILQCLAKETWERPKAKELTEHAQSWIDRHPYDSKNKGAQNGRILPTDVKDDGSFGDNSSDTPEDNVPNPENTSGKSKTGMVVSLVLLALLLGAMGFMGWKLLHREPDPNAYSEEADNAMFSICNTGSDYRAYMKMYPEGIGSNFELAKTRLEEWVRDSINATQELVSVEPEQSNAEVNNNEKNKDKITDKDLNQDKNKDINNKAKVSDEEEKPIDTDWGKQDPKPKEQPSKNTPNGNLTSSHSGITPANPHSAEGNSGLHPAQGGGSGLTGAGTTTEETAYNEIAPKIENKTVTLEDCKKYLRKYTRKGEGCNADHWEVVASNFKRLYVKQIQNCSTVEEIDLILNNHDALMKELHLDGKKEYDSQPKKIAEKQKKELK